MAIDYQQMWNDAVCTRDKAKAIQTLSGVLVEKEGRVFISRLDTQNAELCVEILDDVSRRDLHSPHSPPSHAIRQGIIGHNLELVEKRAFFITLRRLAERHRRLPERIRTKEKIEVESDEILGSGGFADVRPGTYEGRPVAVKVMRASAKDNFVRIRKVSIGVGLLGRGLSHLAPAILQGSCSLEHAVPSERLGTRRGTGGHK